LKSKGRFENRLSNIIVADVATMLFLRTACISNKRRGRLA